VKTKNGVADVVLEGAIIELKYELTPGALDSALSQLWWYSVRLKCSRSVIVCAKASISYALWHTVEAGGVRIFRFPEEGHQLIESLLRWGRAPAVN
jgi:hypothetical protein